MGAKRTTCTQAQHVGEMACPCGRCSHSGGWAVVVHGDAVAEGPQGWQHADRVALWLAG